MNGAADMEVEVTAFSSTSPRIFISAGEPSGDLHGGNLIRALRAACPQVRCEGFGSDRMKAAGCELLFDMTHHSAVGVLQVVRQIRSFRRLLNEAGEHLRTHRPDALVLIDYPGFNWWMARKAKALGVPVVYFVPPQIWAWASHRVKKMRKYVDRVLATLPFERPWYAARGIDAPFIGHPYFDEMHRQVLDADFTNLQKSRPGRIVGILPGSRRYEIENSLAPLIRAAARIGSSCPDVRFLTACFNREQAESVAALLRTMSPSDSGRIEGDLSSGLRAGWDLPIELCVGRTPEIIDAAHSCLAVSGSVSLELLHAARPSVILYRVPMTSLMLYYMLRNVKQVSLVNLMAGKKLFPEYVTSRCPSRFMADDAIRWLNDESAHRKLRDELIELRNRTAVPGACSRAAEEILSLVAQRRLKGAA